MTKAYDPENVFAKILRGDLPCAKVYESDHCLAFKDIAPQAPVHVLVVPKKPYVDFCDFSVNASAEEVMDFNKTVGLAGRRLSIGFKYWHEWRARGSPLSCPYFGRH